MQFFTSTLVLATLAMESVSAISLQHAHRHLHAKKSDLNAVIDAQIKRDAWVPPPGYVPSDMSWTTNSKLMAFTKTMGDAAGATPGVFVGSPAEAAPAPVAPTTTAAPVVAAPTPSATPSKASTGASLLSDVSDAMDDVESLISKASLSITGGTCLPGMNPTSSGTGSKIWIGKDGAYVTEMVAPAGEDVTLVLWNDTAALGKALFVQTVAPLITIQIPQGKSIFVSMSDGISGAFTALYEGKTAFAADGFIHNTLGEFTISGATSTFDVSYETAGLAGSDMTITTPNGCVSSATTCSFWCKDRSAPSCEYAGTYTLLPGTGCTMGENAGSASGGCSGFSSGGGSTTVKFL